MIFALMFLPPIEMTFNYSLERAGYLLIHGQSFQFIPREETAQAVTNFMSLRQDK